MGNKEETNFRPDQGYRKIRQFEKTFEKRLSELCI